MYPHKKTVCNTPYEQVVSELRGAVPGLQAIADRAYALAASTDLEGRRRGMERIGIRAADLIIAISGLAQ